MQMRLFAAFALLSTIALGCQTPNQNPCGTGSTCSSANKGEWTYTDGSLIEAQASSVSFSDLTTNCYCEHVDSGGLAATLTNVGGYVLATVCGGPTGNQVTQGFQYWWDGKQTLVSGYDSDRVFDDYKYMLCSSSAPVDLTTNSSMELVGIAWLDPTPKIEAQLPAGTASNPDGLCPGYSIDGGDDWENKQVATWSSSNVPVNCTCQETVVNSIESNNIYAFNTICDNAGVTYWNGAGFRRVRALQSSNQGSQSVFDSCTVDSEVPASTTLAYVVSNGAASPVQTTFAQTTAAQTNLAQSSPAQNSQRVSSASQSATLSTPAKLSSSSSSSPSVMRPSSSLANPTTAATAVTSTAAPTQTGSSGSPSRKDQATYILLVFSFASSALLTM